MTLTTLHFPSARKVARRTCAIALCAALLVLASCGSSRELAAPQYTFDGVSPAPTERASATPSPAPRSGGIVVASSVDATPPVGAVRTPTPPWTEVADGPVPPFAPALLANAAEVTATPSSYLGSLANLPVSRHLYKGATGNAGDGPPPLRDVEIPLTLAKGWDQTENYLVMGTDRRSGEHDWRTDTLMVVGIDRANRRAAILSIPRDFYVDIPGYGWGRINQADIIGEGRGEGNGPALLGEIIESQFGIPIDHWMRIHMDGFIPVVDALGGIDITLDTPFYDMWQSADGASRLDLYLPAGEQHLDGHQAYLFSRLRYVGSDIGRASRQRTVIWALRDKLLQGDTLFRLPELYAAYQQYVSTDLSIVDLLLLAQMAVSLNQEDVRSGGIGLADLESYLTSGGAQVLIMNDPLHVREVVESVWNADAPTLADSFRGNLPGTLMGPPVVAVSPALSSTASISGTAEISPTLDANAGEEMQPPPTSEDSSTQEQSEQPDGNEASESGEGESGGDNSE